MKQKLFFCLMAVCSFVCCACAVRTEEANESKTIQQEKQMKDELSMHISDEELEITGFSGEYTFLYITDTHMVVPDEADSDKVEAYADLRFDEFQNEDDVSSAAQFGAWMEYANEKQVDALLLGGDIIDYPSSANIEHLEENLELLKMPYLYALGNHDWTFPWEYMTRYGEETYLPMLEPYMQSDSAIHQLEFEDLILVAVDNSANQIAPEALEEYREILQKGKPVIVMLHVPLLTQSVLTKAKEAWSSAVVLGGGNYGGIYPDETSAEFISLTTAGDSPVVAVLAGHVHFFDKDMINERIVQIVGDAGYKGEALLLTVTGSKKG